VEPAIVSLVVSALGGAVGAPIGFSHVQEVFAEWLRRRKDISEEGTARHEKLDPKLSDLVARVAGEDSEAAHLLSEAVSSTPGALQTASVALALQSESRVLASEGDDVVMKRLTETSDDLADLAVDESLLPVYAESISEFYPWASSESVQSAALWSALRFEEVSRGLRLDDESYAADARFLNDLLGASPPAVEVTRAVHVY
jgi:hypothetical protein